MTSPAHGDALFASLNPLVMDGTLTPNQADQVYDAVRWGVGRSTDVDTRRSEGWDRARLWTAMAVLTAGLLSTTYLVAWVVDSERGFGWKTFVFILGVTLVLAAAAVVCLLRVPTRVWAVWLSGLLGALALTAFAVGIVVLWEPDALVYVSSIVLLLGGAAAYWSLRGQPYAVVTVLGGAVLLAKIFSDTLGDSGDQGDVLTVGIAFLLYGLVVTAAGWVLPCRHLLGALGLGLGLASMFVVIVVDATAAAFSIAFPDPGLADGPLSDDFSSVRSDIRIALVLGLAVAVLAAVAHAYTGRVGFSVVSYLGTAVLPLTAVFSLQTDHPLRWAAVLAVVGTLGLAAMIAIQLDRRPRPSAPPTYAGTSIDPGQPPDPHTDTIQR
jgi:hypothetical protein